MQARSKVCRFLFLSALLVLAGALLWRAGPAQEQTENATDHSAGSTALVLTIDDAISVATAEYFLRGLETAVGRQAGLVILELDTPGGLMQSMRSMIDGILASEVPVAVYVTPNGARAASAGTYILYAGHVAAMSPVSTLGAATPVTMGGSAITGLVRRADAEADGPAAEKSGNDGGAGSEEPAAPAPPADEKEREQQETPPGPLDFLRRNPDETADPDAEAMRRKMINDSVAYIVSLARQRERNEEWAEKAVREGATLDSKDAVEQNVADFVARDLAHLLEQADGLEVEVNGRMVTLRTLELRTERLDPDWRTRLLAFITNPAVLVLLLSIGTTGLLLEALNPGSLLPGTAGVICLLLAAYGLQLMPVNWAGLALMALGVGLIVTEAITPSFGVLGTGGIAAFVFGSILLFDSDVPGFEAPIGVITGIGLAAGLAMLTVAVMFARSRRRRVVSGAEGLVGRRALVLEDFESAGPVLVQGERWHATSASPARKGQELYVYSVDRLRLEVGDSPPEQGARPNLFSLLNKKG